MMTYNYPATNTAAEKLGKMEHFMVKRHFKALERHIGDGADIELVYPYTNSYALGISPELLYITKPFPEGVTSVPWSRVTSVNLRRGLMTHTVRVTFTGQEPQDLSFMTAEMAREVLAEIQKRMS